MMIPDSITEFKLPDGAVIRLEDWVDKPVFSTVELLTGFNDRTVAAFTYNVGEEVNSTSNVTTRRIATERDTNIATAGGNASSEEILVFAVRVEPYLLLLTEAGNATTASFGAVGMPIPTAPQLGALNCLLMLRLMVSQKAYVEEGLGYFNTGFGPFGTGMPLHDAGAAAPRSYANHGLPSNEALRYYRMPHHIGGTEKYSVEVKNWNGSTINFLSEASPPVTVSNTMYRLIIHLEGARKRPTA